MSAQASTSHSSKGRKGKGKKVKSKPSKHKKHKQTVIIVSLFELLPLEVQFLVLVERANALLVTGSLGDDYASQASRIARRSFLAMFCRLNQSLRHMLEPVLYADVCLRQLSPLPVPALTGPEMVALTERMRYQWYKRAIQMNPARYAHLRSVDAAEITLDSIFFERLDRFINLRALGTVWWPQTRGSKGELRLMTAAEWEHLRWGLDKDRERQLAYLARRETLKDLHELGAPMRVALSSVSSEAGAAKAKRPDAPKPPLYALAMAIAPFAGHEQATLPTADEWFDLSTLRSLSICGKHHPAILPPVVVRAASTHLAELRLEGWSANNLATADLVTILETVGHSLRLLILTPIEQAEFPPEVFACCPALETLSLNATPSPAFDALVAVGHDRLRTLYLGRPGEILGAGSASSTTALLGALAGAHNAGSLGALATVGLHALDFMQDYVCASTGVHELGCQAGRHGWALVDGRGRAWDPDWVKRDDGWGPVGGSDDEDHEAGSSDEDGLV